MGNVPNVGSSPPGGSTVSLPKAHLHLHLEGSARPATIAELAQRKGVSLDEFWDFKGPDDFYERYLLLSDLIAGIDDLARICSELVEDESAQGVVYTQPGVSPHHYSPRLGSVEDVFTAMAEAFERASIATGVKVGPMIEVDLMRTPHQVEEMARFAAGRAHHGVDAFGIATFEPDPRLHRFARASDIVKEAGLLFVPHAGEHDGPENVRDALDFLRPDRIAHGIRSVGDRSVLNRLAAERIPCDVCPTSNVRLNAVPDLSAHPLPTMLESGVPVTINADDQLFFGSGVADEYGLVQQAFGLTNDELASIARTSGAASGAPGDVIERIHSGVDAWLSANG